MRCVGMRGRVHRFLRESLPMDINDRAPQSPRPTTVADIVVRAQRGDRGAQAELYERYWDSTVALAARRLRDSTAAEDLAQDVFIHAFQRLDQLRTPAAFGGWLRQITTRMAINMQTRRRVPQAMDDNVMGALASTADGPVDLVLREERTQQVRSGIQQLGETDRETLRAFYFDDQSIHDMARRFDAPAGTIKRRLHTARHRLARYVAEPQAI
ncbi:MAG: sigma-70 family RNA polymerase sigma factor [Planctomycetota bacterium]|nr:MAG: sigma-70 family RNA polymerase sigma factor [Planctomycetota bacterium]